MDAKEKEIIRGGLVSGGMSEYLSSVAKLSDYEPRGGGRVFTIKLNFSGSFAFSSEILALNRYDALGELAKEFAHDFLIKLLSEIPLGAVGDKIILTQKEYAKLRRLASTSPIGSFSQVYDSEFGRQFGTHP